VILFTKYQINNESNIGMENGNKELARRIGTENWNGTKMFSIGVDLQETHEG
jgi:hypothetical protein